MASVEHKNSDVSSKTVRVTVSSQKRCNAAAKSTIKVS